MSGENDYATLRAMADELDERLGALISDLQANARWARDMTRGVDSRRRTKHDPDIKGEQ